MFHCSLLDYCFSMHLCIAIFAFAVTNVFAFEAPDIYVENGKIVGLVQRSVDGVKYAAYKGIPYAQPPIGNLRFQPPKWLDQVYADGLLLATRFGPQCMAYDNLLSDVRKDKSKSYYAMGSEDCLYLNVFVPEGATNLAVVVFIHGGGFGFGTSKQFQPTYIMNRKDVVVVTINYRLGAFGFMALGTSDYPGNMGLKDQAMALKWVQRNIRKFGGNPGSVTISGMSAGGASTHLAYLSPMMDGLFHRGYSYSGSALVPWGLWSDLAEKTRRLGALLNCPTNDDSELMDCLRERPALSIAGTQRSMQEFFFNPFTVFGPTVEFNNSDYYINTTPFEIIRRGGAKTLPWITAYTQEDGLYSAAEYLGNPGHLQQLDSNWDEYLPHIIFFNQTVSGDEKKKLAATLKREYLDGQPLTEATSKKFLDMVTDRLYGMPCIFSAQEMAKFNPNVYMYYFRYRGNSSVTDSFDKSKNFGVGHADDSAFVFELPHVNMRSTPSDVAMSDFLINLLVEYAKTGAPPSELGWKPFDNRKDFNYLEIFGPNNHSMKHDTNIGSSAKYFNSFSNERYSPHLDLKLHPVANEQRFGRKLSKTGSKVVLRRPRGRKIRVAARKGKRVGRGKVVQLSDW